MRDGPIRMLHLVSSLNRRGAELSAVRLADQLPRELFLPALWAITPTSSGPALAPERTPVLSPVGAARRPAAYDRFRQLVAVLREFRPHLVHCHGGRALKYAAASGAFWRADGYVYTKIGSIHPWLDHPLRRLIYGRIFERFDAIVAVGEEIRREVERTFHLRHPRLVTIPTGIDPRPFERVTPEDVTRLRGLLTLAPGEVCLMAVGSLSWEKDPHLLVRLCAALMREGRTPRLVFVGGGPLEAELGREVGRAGLAGRVHFLGTREDVPQLLAVADVAVLPSVTEGLPAALIEAGMAARPAVAFGVGAVGEVLEEGVTGFIVPPGDEPAFLQRLRRLIDEPELRRRMGEAAQARCRREFNLDRYVARHVTLFLKLVGARFAHAAAAGMPAETPSPTSSVAGEGVP